jgi:hypothetical protein
VFSFQCSMQPGASYAALIEGPLKIVLREDEDALRAGEPWRAFDLEQDAREREDRAASDWARELARRLGPRAADLLRPAIAADAARLDAAARARLEELGYAGD